MTRRLHSGEVAELERRIRSAFAGGTPPCGALVGPSRWRDAEREEADAAFRSKRWGDLEDASWLREHDIALTCFKPTAFAYYLPAFMLAAIRDPEEADTVVGSVMFALTPPQYMRETQHDAEIVKKFQRVPGCFTARQAQVIADVLEYMCRVFEGDEVEIKAVAYWSSLAQSGTPDLETPTGSETDDDPASDAPTPEKSN